MRPRTVVRDDGFKFLSLAEAARFLQLELGIQGRHEGIAANIARAAGRSDYTAYGHRWEYMDDAS